MILNVNALNVSNKVQSFGCKYGNGEVLNKPGSPEDLGSYKKQKTNIVKPKVPYYMNNTLEKSTFNSDVSKIKAVEKEFLSVKDAVDYDSLEIKNYCVGNSPEEKLFNALTHPDIYFYNGRPYTGYTKEVSDDGSGIYNKFENGLLRRTFMKNPETGFMGYTDEKDECAKYYKETPNQRTLLTSEYVGKAGCGANKVKLITVTPKGVNVKSYMATDDVTDKEYQRLTKDVIKVFGDDLSCESYYIFA